ncbi:MAG: hypothetical protein ACLVHV_10675 [Oscillospiraceae bacterium]
MRCNCWRGGEHHSVHCPVPEELRTIVVVLYRLAVVRDTAKQNEAESTCKTCKRCRKGARSVETLGKLTPELQRAVESAGTLAEVEDLYRPYRPKRRTRATVAREKGLEPLAAELNRQDGRDPAVLAAAYCNAELGVETVEEALAGASISAEEISVPSVRPSNALMAVTPSPLGSEKDSRRNTHLFPARSPAAGPLALNRGEKRGFLISLWRCPGRRTGAGVPPRSEAEPGRCLGPRRRPRTPIPRLIAPAAGELRGNLTDRLGRSHQNFVIQAYPARRSAVCGLGSRSTGTDAWR